MCQNSAATDLYLWNHKCPRHSEMPDGKDHNTQLPLPEWEGIVAAAQMDCPHDPRHEENAAAQMPDTGRFMGNGFLQLS
jgi:hypothetical protein